jgi:hypothetical protein
VVSRGASARKRGRAPFTELRLLAVAASLTAMLAEILSRSSEVVKLPSWVDPLDLFFPPLAEVVPSPD